MPPPPIHIVEPDLSEYSGVSKCLWVWKSKVSGLRIGFTCTSMHGNYMYLYFSPEVSAHLEHVHMFLDGQSGGCMVHKTPRVLSVGDPHDIEDSLQSHA